jgi:diguanylate cyclase (GGDEF)-like protein
VLSSLYAAPALSFNYSNGIADLSCHDFNNDGNVNLDCLWEFRWDRMLVPGDPGWGDTSGIQGYYPVPLFWTGYRGLNLPSCGCATYRLKVKTRGDLRHYGLKTPEIFTEYRLWINGELIDQRGSLAGDKVRFMKPSVFTFHTDSDLIEIILQVKNNSHGNAGIGQSIILGTEKQVYRHHIMSIIMEITLIAVCIFAGFYHTIIYVFRKEEKELLYFGLFCIIIAARTFLTGNTLVSHVFDDLTFSAGSRVSTAVIPLSVITFQIFAYYFFKEIAPKRIVIFITLPHVIYLFLIFATPTIYYTTVYTYYLTAILASFLLVVAINIAAIIKRIKYSVIFFTGFSFIFAGAANDMLHYLQVINTGYYLALFFSAFIITESLMLAIKFSREHRMVSALSERLKTLDKLKDEFLANTSHELRTPLNGIIGIAESLLDGVTGSLPAGTNQNLKLIVSSGRRLYSLINDILDLSRLKNNDISIHKRSIDIRQLVSIVMDVLNTSMPGKEVSLINAIPEDAPFIEADESRMQQIMYNLIGNGVKFTARGHVKVSMTVKENCAEIHVEDTGIGIASGRLEAIFKSFEQGDGSASREYSGTGLGLSITKKLIELHGGEIKVESEPGSGSCFSFTIPGLSSSRNVSGHVINSSVFPPLIISHEFNIPESDATVTDKTSAERILIVDDESINIQVLLNHLSFKNYRTDYAINGFEAIEKIFNDEYSLILLDLMMPGMSGYEVCRKIREKYSSFELPVIILTARDRSSDIVAAFEAGANDYLVKPLDRIELFARIHTQLALRHAVRNAILNAELANRDHLTNLYNRRFFINAGTREFESSRRYNREMSVIMIDIDNFKSINDNFGHDAGDIIIKNLVSIISINIRGIDIPGRFGGDEFLLILPGTGTDGAVSAGEKIRSLAEQNVIITETQTELKFTISIGISSFRQNVESFESMVKEADEMLYVSKKNGRNRVTVYLENQKPA